MTQIKSWFAKKFWSLKFRMILLFISLMLVSAGILLGIFLIQLRANFQEFSKSMIRSTSKIIYQSIYDGMMSNEKQIIQRNLDLLVQEPTIKGIRIFRPSGTIIFSSKADEKKKNVFGIDQNVIRPRSQPDTLFKEVGDDYFYQYPIVIHKECLQCHVNEENKIKAYMNVYAGYPMSDRFYSSVKSYTFIGLLIMIGLMWLLMNILYKKQIESRLQKINTGFKQLATGNLNIKVNMPGQHELAEMAQKFNQTVKELRKAKEKEDQVYLDKLSQADRLVTLGEVVTEIAHAVNNPAGIVLSRIEYLRDQLAAEKIHENLINDLDAVIRQIELIGKVTRNIMYFSRRLPGGFSKVNLNEVVQNSVEILEPKLKKYNTKVELNLCESQSFIWGNSVQLEQVFCNLINNSLDVLEQDKGIIKIDISEIVNEKKYIHFRILFQDNGPGIRDGIQEHIFYPFFSTKPQDKGTGLGLFIAKNIIKNHGGKIKLDKTFKQGACFVICLGKYE